MKFVTVFNFGDWIIVGLLGVAALCFIYGAFDYYVMGAVHRHIARMAERRNKLLIDAVNPPKDSP